MSARPAHPHARLHARSVARLLLGSRPSTGPILLALAALLSILNAPVCLAILPAQPGPIAVELPVHQTAYIYDRDGMEADPAAVAAGATLVREFGADWRITAWNQYARAPRLAYGPGVVVAPAGLAGANEAAMERLARELIATHADFFGTDGRNLERMKIVHAVGKWSVLFRQVEEGVRVRGAAILLAFTDGGKLFAVGSNLYGIDLPLRPTIERPVARALARGAIAYDPTVDLTAGPEELVVVPIHRAPGEVDLRLTHQIDVPASEPYGLWRTWIDAHSGEIIERTDQVNYLYSGSVAADVEISSYCDGDTPDSPFVHTYVAVADVDTAVTDTNGDFSLAGNSGSHGCTVVLDGLDFYVDCIDCGGNAIWNGTIEPDVPLAIHFDATTYRPDERDTFYFANMTKQFIWSIDPDYVLDKYRIEVNYNATCNATHNWGEKRLRFYHEGDGCANTGRLGDVIAHEYGHGLQASMHGGTQAQQGLGEGNSDIAGTFMTDDPLIARGWHVDECDSGLGRHCLNDLIYPDDVIDQQIHYAGQVICGFNWDLRLLLEAKLGPAAGKAYTAHLWHFSRKMFGYEDMTQPEQVEAYIMIDDDDGNVANGTPNFAEIYEAAENHGFAPYIMANPNRIELAHTPLPDTGGLGPYAVEIVVRTFDAGDPVAPTSVELFYAENAGAYAMLPMSATSGDTLFAASIPAQEAGTVITYYVRATYDARGLEEFHPDDAPATYHMFGVGDFIAAADFPMEMDDGWTVGAPGDSVWDGEWERDDPNMTQALGTLFQPEDDHTPDPGTDCWLTGNPPAGSWPFIEELDGKTSLNSPILDLAGTGMVRGSFWVFTYFEGGNPEEGGDYLDLNLSTDAGATWTTLEHLYEANGEWVEITLRLSPYDFDFTDQMLFRFVAEDRDPTFNYVECLIDDFMLEKLSSGSAGLTAETASAPLRLRLGEARPNPFNPSTRIDYSLPARASVDLAIYDVQGRLVRKLVSGIREPGDHQVRWDARDARGVAAASGVYFYRIEVGDWSEAHTLVLLK